LFVLVLVLVSSRGGGERGRFASGWHFFFAFERVVKESSLLSSVSVARDLVGKIHTFRFGKTHINTSKWKRE